MKQLKYYVLFMGILAGSSLHSQDYTLVPTNPNATGQPGELFLAQIKIQNNSNEGISMHFERIVNNLPGTWTSCFCYPHCIAPWIDTMSFSIAAFSLDSISPNFGTDSFPAIADVKIVLWQEGYINNPDTITFTGSTMAAEVTETQPQFEVIAYPSPFTEFIILEGVQNNDILNIINCQGEIVARQPISYGQNVIHLDELAPGAYYLFLPSKQQAIRVLKSE